MSSLVLPAAWAAITAGDAAVGAAVARLDRATAARVTTPDHTRLLAGFLALAPSEVRVVILGQDPYPTPGHACGLAFAVAPGCPEVPRSLRNILAEVQRDVGSVATATDLARWTGQGVLLLNRWLSLDADLRDDWDVITGACLRRLWQDAAQPLVACLWGRPAMLHGAWMSAPLPLRRLVLTASHPSPLSYRRPCGDAPAFSGCGHFSAVNRYLNQERATPIAW